MTRSGYAGRSRRDDQDMSDPRGGNPNARVRKSSHIACPVRYCRRASGLCCVDKNGAACATHPERIAAEAAMDAAAAKVVAEAELAMGPERSAECDALLAPLFAGPFKPRSDRQVGQ